MKIPSICLIASDCGETYGALAALLASRGFSVTLMAALEEPLDSLLVHDLVFDFAKQNVQFLELPFLPYEVDTLEHARVSYRAYQWLKKQNFDMIRFSNEGGSSYFSALAKRQGLAFAKTVLDVDVFTTSMLESQAMDKPLSRLSDLELEFLEKKGVALADEVFVSSKKMQDWLKEQNWLNGKSATVVPVCSFAVGAPSKNHEKVRSLVFWGNLGKGGGLEVFTRAIDYIKGQIPLSEINVVFCGPTGRVGEATGVAHIDTCVARWNIERKLIEPTNLVKKIPEFQREGALVVLCSPSPKQDAVELSCRRNHIPCLRETADSKKLAQKIFQHLNSPQDLPLRNFEADDEGWLTAIETRFAKLKGKSKQKLRPQAKPMVSVCVTHKNRPWYLRQALQSLKNQSYKNIELIVVDDGTDQPDCVRDLAEIEKKLIRPARGKLFKTAGIGPGGARNLAAKKAKGKYLMFMDDDNVAKPNEVETFVRIAELRQTDILTCTYERFYLKSSPDFKESAYPRWVPLGDAVTIGPFICAFGDMNSLIRRKYFIDSGGLPTDKVIGDEDWEFFAKAVLNGAKLETVHEPLFLYREQAEGERNSKVTPRFKNSQTRLRPYLKRIPENMRLPFLFTTGFVRRQREESFDPELKEENRLSRITSDMVVPTWELRSSKDFRALKVHNAQVSWLPLGLKITAEKDDPKLIFDIPLSPVFASTIIEVEMFSDVSTKCQLFYKLKGQEEFCEGTSKKRPIGAGNNRFYFLVESPHLSSRFRFDPGECKGNYVIKRMRVYQSMPREVAQHYLNQLSFSPPQTQLQNQ